MLLVSLCINLLLTGTLGNSDAFVNHMLPSTTVCDLGILFIDSEVSMWSHVCRTVSGCFAVL